MNEDTIEVLNLLKSSPFDKEVDHIHLLHGLYKEYSEGSRTLQPRMNYFLNGLDDLPTLRDRKNWNKKRFDEIRKPFTDSHHSLVKAIDEILENEIQQHKID